MTDVATVVLAMTGEQAEHVLTGERTVEIRRSRMNWTVDRMLIYQTDIGLVVGEIRMRGMLAATPDTIWNEYGAASLMSRQTFDESADGANRLYAYRLEHPLRYETAKPLTDIGVTHAPKDWCWLPGKASRPVVPRPSYGHLSETERLLKDAADQWELHRFAVHDDSDAAKTIGNGFNALLRLIGDYRKTRKDDQ